MRHKTIGGPTAMMILSVVLLVCIALMFTIIFAVSECDNAKAATVNAGETRRLRAAILWLGERGKCKIPKKRAALLARLFVKYGKIWKVNPWIAASVAYQESKFTDKPKKLLVERCKKVWDDAYGEVEICKIKWPGERGMMQVVPKYARDSFSACKGRSWNDPNEMQDTETNVCVSMHLMAARRSRVRTRRSFVLRGGRGRRTYRHAPCGPRQRKFCRKHRALCKKFWWVASWNWGSHRVICTSRGRYDFAGYPIRVLKRYKRIVGKFRGRK